MLDRLHHMETIAAIQEGMASAERGELKPAAQVFEEMRACYGLSSGRLRKSRLFQRNARENEYFTKKNEQFGGNVRLTACSRSAQGGSPSAGPKP